MSLKTNFAINVFGAIFPLAVALVTVPIYVRHIGDARYGVPSIVWVPLGYFGFLDLGLSRAAANALARLRDAPQTEWGRVLVTTLVLNFGLGLVGSFFLAMFGSCLLQNIHDVPAALQREIAWACPWIVELFPLALVSGVGVGTLESQEHFLLANVLQVSGMSLGQIMPVVFAVFLSPLLAIVIPAAVVARALTVAAILIAVYHDEGPLSLAAFDRRQARKFVELFCDRLHPWSRRGDSLRRADEPRDAQRWRGASAAGQTPSVCFGLLGCRDVRSSRRSFPRCYFYPARNC